MHWLSYHCLVYLVSVLLVPLNEFAELEVRTAYPLLPLAAPCQSAPCSSGLQVAKILHQHHDDEFADRFGFLYMWIKLLLFVHIVSLFVWTKCENYTAFTVGSCSSNSTEVFLVLVFEPIPSASFLGYGQLTGFFRSNAADNIIVNKYGMRGGFKRRWLNHDIILITVCTEIHNKTCS